MRLYTLSMLNVKLACFMNNSWWAWYPVKTVRGQWVWFRQVIRDWDESLKPWCDAYTGYSGTDGGWKYYQLNRDNTMNIYRAKLLYNEYESCSEGSTVQEAIDRAWVDSAVIQGTIDYCNIALVVWIQGVDKQWQVMEACRLHSYKD